MSRFVITVQIEIDEEDIVDTLAAETFVEEILSGLDEVSFFHIDAVVEPEEEPRG